MKSIQSLPSCLMVVAVLALAIGCTGRESPSKGGKNDHTHGAGPHGGALADWADGKYHVEFTVSHPDEEATVYILGSDEKSAVPIKAKDAQLLLKIKEPAFEVVLKSTPQKSDPEGKSSRFVGNHKKLGLVQEFAGTISAEVDGTQYTGEFKEEPEAEK